MSTPVAPQLLAAPVQELDLADALQTALERRYLGEMLVRGLQFQEAPAYSVQRDTRFFRLEELTHEADLEQTLDLLNMQNVLASLQEGSHSIIFLLDSDGEKCTAYFGIAPSAGAIHSGAGGLAPEQQEKVLRRALSGNFPGIKCGNTLRDDDFSTQVLTPLWDRHHIAAFTGIPSPKTQRNEPFVQGLDRLTGALWGERFSLLVVAEPIPGRELDGIIHQCQLLSSEIHLHVSQYLTMSRGQSTGVNDSTSDSTSISGGTGALSALLNFSIGKVKGTTTGRSQQDTTGQSISLQKLNKTALECEQTLDQYIARLKRGKGVGFWNTGMFLLTDSRDALLRGQVVIRGLYSGLQSHLEPIQNLDLTGDTGEVAAYLAGFCNPVLHLQPGDNHPLGETFEKLATPLSTDELALLVNLPHREIPGLRIRPQAEFGINPPPVDGGVELGKTLYQGRILASQPVAIAPRSLTKHTFITGITGSGKTNTCLVLLKAAHERGIPFMVIEPAKSEYRALLMSETFRDKAWLFTLGYEGTAGKEPDASPFRLNPFEFPAGFPLLTHLDLLKAVFNAAFPMYASMPYILEEALLEVYTDRGWDLARSSNKYLSADGDRTAYMPRLSDLYAKIDDVVLRKKYAQQLTLDITAALKARISSLLVGGKGAMLDVQRGISFDDLLKHPVILELRRIGDDDEKAFVMALLLIRLFEHREVSGASRKLVHLTLVEEAHRLLRQVPMTSADSANPRGKAVELFTDMLAEIREYGEGMVVVDQVPAKLAADVVKNTNLKVMHRLVARDDRDWVGNSINLSESQKEHVVRLRPGEAVVYSEGLEKPVLVQITDLKDSLRSDLEANSAAFLDQLAAIRRENSKSFQRYAACSNCALACEFYSDRTRPSPVLVTAFQQMLPHLLYAGLHDAPQSLAQLNARLQTAFANEDRHRLKDPGGVHCTLAQLVNKSVSDWSIYYTKGVAGLEHVRCAEEALMELLCLLDAAAPQAAVADRIGAFRSLAWTKIALQPQLRRPGCSVCRHICRYGAVVQRLAQADRDGLALAIRTTSATDQGFHNNYPALVKLAAEYAAQTLPLPLSDDDWAHAGYCILSNVTPNKRVLIGYQRALAQ